MRFLWAFLGWIGLFAGVLLTALAVVNPRREFSGTRFPALQLDTRQLKGDLFDSSLAHEPPSGVIIGSSRSMNLPTDEFTSVTGERFFNFGVFNATIEDDLAIARYVLAKAPNVRNLVVGIDPQSFDAHIGPLPELTHNARLSTALNGSVDSPLKRAIVVARAYRDALTVAYLADVIESVRNAAHPPEPAYSFSAEGILQYPKADRERRAGTYNWQQHYAGCAAVQQSEFANYDSLATSKRAMLDSLISEATARGVHIVLWIPPFNPALADSLRGKPAISANYERVVSYLRSRARPPLVTMADEDGTANLPNPTGWYDCMHFDSTNAVAVAHSLATAVRDAGTGNTETVAAR